MLYRDSLDKFIINEQTHSVNTNIDKYGNVIDFNFLRTPFYIELMKMTKSKYKHYFFTTIQPALKNIIANIRQVNENRTRTDRIMIQSYQIDLEKFDKNQMLFTIRFKAQGLFYPLCHFTFLIPLLSDIYDDPDFDFDNHLGDIIVSKYLNSICHNTGNCLAFGIEQENINYFFDYFTNFKHVKSMSFVGSPSVNGFVIKIHYAIKNYTANAILKSSKKASSDNVYYEYLVGLFLNKMNKILPCFMETYHLFRYQCPTFKSKLANKEIVKPESLIQYLTIHECSHIRKKKRVNPIKSYKTNRGLTWRNNKKKTKKNKKTQSRPTSRSTSRPITEINININPDVNVNTNTHGSQSPYMSSLSAPASGSMSKHELKPKSTFALVPPSSSSPPFFSSSSSSSASSASSSSDPSSSNTSKPSIVECIGKSCLQSESIAILIQSIDDSISLNDFIVNKSTIKNFKIKMVEILYQVYVALDYLKDVFTHYDLHGGNVLLYQLPKNQCVCIRYHHSNGTSTTIKTNYLVKIIDYGKSFFNDIESNISSLTVHEILMRNENKSCRKAGYFSFYESTGILPYLKNNSTDLRLVQILQKHVPEMKLMPTITYQNKYDTPEIHDSRNKQYINTVSDMRICLELFIHGKPPPVPEPVRIEVGQLDVYLTHSIGEGKMKYT